ncbi:MAG: ABC transporter ATP-binding protein [Dictyoglomaceae bacterium]
MIVLKAKNLRSYYILDVLGKKQIVKAVDDVSLEIEENEIYGIAGESGCGKTTLIKTLYGMIEPPLNVIDGEVTYKINDEFINILALEEEELDKIRWEYISYIPQGSMSVLNPVTRIIDTFWDFIKAHSKSENKDEIEDSIKEHLSALGLPLKILKAYPHQLSGGMRQRVTIALATILKPKIIIADEPSTALDVVAQRGVIQLLKDIQSSQKNTIILVTHDMGVHATISDRIAIMYAGNIIEEAKTEELYENPLHPYTKYLIGSLPKIGDKSYKVSAPGTPPSLVNPPLGCRFHPRCDYVMPECKINVPKFISIKPQHKVACFLYSKEVES